MHPDKRPKDYPAVKAHLERYRSRLKERAASQEWFELQQAAVGLLPLLAKPKIVYPIITPGPRFALDTEKFLINDKLFVLPTDSLFLLGLLNSSLARWFFASVCAKLEGSGDCYYEYRAQFVERFPVNLLDGGVRSKNRRDRVEQLVTQVLDTQARILVATNERDREYYIHKCSGLEAEIDSLVVELYGLSSDEVAVIQQTQSAPLVDEPDDED